MAAVFSDLSTILSSRHRPRRNVAPWSTFCASKLCGSLQHFFLVKLALRGSTASDLHCGKLSAATGIFHLQLKSFWVIHQKSICIECSLGWKSAEYMNAVIFHLWDTAADRRRQLLPGKRELLCAHLQISTWWWYSVTRVSHGWKIKAFLYSADVCFKIWQHFHSKRAHCLWCKNVQKMCSDFHTCARVNALDKDLNQVFQAQEEVVRHGQLKGYTRVNSLRTCVTRWINVVQWPTNFIPHAQQSVVLAANVKCQIGASTDNRKTLQQHHLFVPYTCHHTWC